MDDELVELVPVFVAEARERLQRLADLVPALARGPEALIEIKRELHTLKGAGRMMAISPFAELCHAAEEVVLSRPADLARLLLAAHDALATMVESVEAGEPVAPATELLAEFERGGAAGSAPAQSGPQSASPAPPAAPSAPPAPAQTGGERREG